MDDTPSAYSVPPDHPVGAPLPGGPTDNYHRTTFTLVCEWRGSDDCLIEQTAEFLVSNRATNDQHDQVGRWHLGKQGWGQIHGVTYCQPCFDWAVEIGVFDD